MCNFIVASPTLGYFNKFIYQLSTKTLLLVSYGDIFNHTFEGDCDFPKHTHFQLTVDSASVFFNVCVGCIDCSSCDHNNLCVRLCFSDQNISSQISDHYF
jgi:hypothetical protein